MKSWNKVKQMLYQFDNMILSLSEKTFFTACHSARNAVRNMTKGSRSCLGL